MLWLLAFLVPSFSINRAGAPAVPVATVDPCERRCNCDLSARAEFFQAIIVGWSPSAFLNGILVGLLCAKLVTTRPTPGKGEGVCVIVRNYNGLPVPFGLLTKVEERHQTRQKLHKGEKSNGIWSAGAAAPLGNRSVKNSG